MMQQPVTLVRCRCRPSIVACGLARKSQSAECASQWPAFGLAWPATAREKKTKAFFLLIWPCMLVRQLFFWFLLLRFMRRLSCVCVYVRLMRICGMTKERQQGRSQGPILRPKAGETRKEGNSAGE